MGLFLAALLTNINKGRNLFRNIIYLPYQLLAQFGIEGSFIYIVPLVWVFMVSFKTNAEIFTSPFALPESFYLDNFTFVWTVWMHSASTMARY